MKDKPAQQTQSIVSRQSIIFAAAAFALAVVAVRYFNEQPFFPDAFYHYNAAGRIAAGEGFVDDYLWTYIGAPDSLPAPSHLYWMPGTSIVAAAGMRLFGKSYAAAQIGIVLMLWGAALLAYGCGGRIGGTSRHAWAAGLITLAGGFFLRWWGTTDTFAPYAFVGTAALALMGKAAVSDRPWRWWFAAGIFAAFGHLIRSDGLLLVAVGWAVILIGLTCRSPDSRVSGLLQTERESQTSFLRSGEGSGLGWSLKPVFQQIAVFTLAYLLAMSPWFMRNLNAVGTILPVGGTQALWYTAYDDLFNYPPDANPQTFFAGGFGLLLQSRSEALFGRDGALLTFIAVEGMIILTPFILIALWKRRRDPFLRPVLWFAIGIHLAFPLLFPFPGMRGGLFHAAAALVPWWAACGITGIDDAVDWMAKRRRQWRGGTGKRIFTVGVVLFVLWLSLRLALDRRVGVYTLPHYDALKQILLPDTRVMINDPAQLYYYTRLGGVAQPNETPDIIPVIAEKYAVDYLLVEITWDGYPALPARLAFDLDNPPPFLREVDKSEYNVPATRLYRILKSAE